VEAKFKKGDKALRNGIKVTILGNNGIPPRIYEVTAGDGNWDCCAEEDLTEIDAENQEERCLKS